MVGVLLVVPTAYWVQLRLPRLRPVIEFITLLPLVIPAIVLVFGYLQLYNPRPGCRSRIAAQHRPAARFGYVTLALPYMYRAVDTGLRAIDVRTLTEAAESLGAGWPTILFRVIFPNVRVAMLSGAFLTFAIVIGEFTFASLLDRPAFGPYLQLVGANRAYEPSALAIIAFAVTWACMGLIQRRRPGSPRCHPPRRADLIGPEAPHGAFLDIRESAKVVRRPERRADTSTSRSSAASSSPSSGRAAAARPRRCA